MGRLAGESIVHTHTQGEARTGSARIIYTQELGASQRWATRPSPISCKSTWRRAIDMWLPRQGRPQPAAATLGTTSAEEEAFPGRCCRHRYPEWEPFLLAWSRNTASAHGE